MYFEINVSLNGRHFFATHERSCRNSSSCADVLKVMLEKFPTSDGYKVSVSFHPERSYGMQPSEEVCKNPGDRQAMMLELARLTSNY